MVPSSNLDTKGIGVFGAEQSALTVLQDCKTAGSGLTLTRSEAWTNEAMNIAEPTTRISRGQVEQWKQTKLILDVVPGRGGMFSRKGPKGARFPIRSWIFADRDSHALDQAGPADELLRHPVGMAGEQASHVA